MNSQLLFLLSALGGLNGIFLSLYFAFFVKKKSQTTYLLSALILAVSVRITKSAFLYFNHYSKIIWFIQIGIIACALIGPFLYLYVKRAISKQDLKLVEIVLNTVPVTLLLVVFFSMYDYGTERQFWNYTIGWGVYTQWFLYVCAALYLLKDTIKKAFAKNETLTNTEVWLLNVAFGVALIWLAYRTTDLTSYVVGALSFSFVFYISILLWIFKRKQKQLFFETDKKYKNTSISDEVAHHINQQLTTVFEAEKLYRNSDLKLNTLAEKLNVNSHQLSQFLNDNLQKSFNQYINEFRIEEAKGLMQKNHQFTLEAIGNEAGFSSKSTFYSTFKKIVGITPAQFRKQNLG